MSKKIPAELVKQLRQATGAGILDCRKALEEAEGDIERAAEILREWGIAKAAKKVGREAREGIIGTYVHMGGKMASMVEVNCETDFVARTDQFQELAHDLAMQVVAARPQYVSREEIPAEVIEREKEIIRMQLADSGKPEHIIERIVEGKLNKWFEEVCLLEQPFIKDEEKTVGDLVKEYIAKLGENIVVRRFARFEIGE